jgi:hypothetical protein
MAKTLQLARWASCSWVRSSSWRRCFSHSLKHGGKSSSHEEKPVVLASLAFISLIWLLHKVRVAVYFVVRIAIEEPYSV